MLRDVYKCSPNQTMLIKPITNKSSYSRPHSCHLGGQLHCRIAAMQKGDWLKGLHNLQVHVDAVQEMLACGPTAFQNATKGIAIN